MNTKEKALYEMEATAMAALAIIEVINVLNGSADNQGEVNQIVNAPAWSIKHLQARLDDVHAAFEVIARSIEDERRFSA